MPRRTGKLQAIGDARIAIEEALSGAAAEPETTTTTAAQRRNLVPWAMAAALAAALGIASAGWWRATRPVDRPLTRLDVDLGPDAMVGLNTTVADALLYRLNVGARRHAPYPARLSVG